ncbi:transposable element Tcb2 transposase [Trichonephila clavipes]|nr:transposable element Tcb2 transposase [Trichonephila clavipes]
MMVLVVQSVNGLCIARFTVWVFGAVDLREYHCSMLAIRLHVLPGQEQCVKGHHTAPTNLTELWTILANIWQVIPMERLRKLVQFMPRRMAAVIKARGGPTHY